MITGNYPAGADVLVASLRLAATGVNAVWDIVFSRENYDSKACPAILTWSGTLPSCCPGFMNLITDCKTQLRPKKHWFSAF
jgi:hypothetical protein